MTGCFVDLLRWVPAYTRLVPGPCWADRHLAALAHPEVPFERALVALLRGWLGFADAHRQVYGRDVEGPLGEEWVRIGEALRGLVTVQLGQRLDGDTLDSVIARTLEAAGDRSSPS